MNIGRLGFYLLHPATFLIASTLLLIGGGNILWQEYGDKISSPGTGPFRSDQIRINEPGTWATPRYNRLVCEQLDKLDINLANLQAVDVIAGAVAKSPSVEHVRKISKSGQTVDISVVWRKPVAAIQMPAGHYRLVDRQGVILDRQVTSDADANQWLRIKMFRVGGQELADWQVWQDSRVLDCAAISWELGDRWKELGLCQIVTFRFPDSVGPASGSFELWTANAAKVIWSDEGPTKEQLLVDTRIEAIRTWIHANGSLDQLLAKRMMLDVRTGVARLIPDIQVASLPEEDGISVF